MQGYSKRKASLDWWRQKLVPLNPCKPSIIDCLNRANFSIALEASRKRESAFDSCDS